MVSNSCFSASKIKLIRGSLIDRARPMNFYNGISHYSLCQEWGVGTALVFILTLTPSILMIRTQTDTSLASAVLKSLYLTHQMERCVSDVCMHVLWLRLFNIFEQILFFFFLRKFINHLRHGSIVNKNACLIRSNQDMYFDHGTG